MKDKNVSPGPSPSQKLNQAIRMIQDSQQSAADQFKRVDKAGVDQLNDLSDLVLSFNNQMLKKLKAGLELND